MPVLLVDSYDSFTFNLKHLIEEATAQTVLTIHNDSFILPGQQDELNALVDASDAIVIGPGPGNPLDEGDTGIIPYLYTRSVPILGICLGFQTLCSVTGGLEIAYMANPVHGQISPIEVIDPTEPLFSRIKSGFSSVRYHSIYVNGASDSVVPLAYTIEGDKKILMAARHLQKPYYGVQYHPESVCSKEGHQLVKNFWHLASEFNKTRKIKSFPIKKSHFIAPPSLLLQKARPLSKMNYLGLRLPSELDTLAICDHLRSRGDDFLLMNSASTPGDWTIIGVPIQFESEVITHSTEDIETVILSKWNSPSDSKTMKISSIWGFVADYMQSRLSKSLETGTLLDECPFHGGLIGMFSYEEGEFLVHQNLNPRTKGKVPDTKLCYIDRFVVRHVATGESFVVSRRSDDGSWIKLLHQELVELRPRNIEVAKSISDLVPGPTNAPLQIHRMDQKAYNHAFAECQRYLKEGNSYELCLTAQTKIIIPKCVDSWDMYKVLVNKNPSPYSCYMDFGDCQLLSSSPERFIKWDNEKAQLRPIKGTVAKSATMTFEKASQMLSTPKEFAENLMIVDLIRHDMYNLVPRVEVPKLMQVEEYSTVYQLVSVIEGYFGDHHTGIDVLSQSLPPGSMTGAPKKRSVEILQKLENNQRRGLYSGVCGYWSVNNNSDWSVIIRSIFSYVDDLESDRLNAVWRIGAGGAVTILSSCQGEWDEMNTKLDSALQAFR